jgi:hypothetical protein
MLSFDESHAPPLSLACAAFAEVTLMILLFIVRISCDSVSFVGKQMVTSGVNSAAVGKPDPACIFVATITVDGVQLTGTLQNNPTCVAANGDTSNTVFAITGVDLQGSVPVTAHSIIAALQVACVRTIC